MSMTVSIPAFRRAAGRRFGALALLTLLSGCTAALEDRVTRQEAALADLHAEVETLRSDLRALRDEATAMRDTLATGAQQAAGARATAEGRTREAQQALDAC